MSLALVESSVSVQSPKLKNTTATPMTALASDPRAFSGAPAAGQPWRARLAVPLSIALHVGLLFALGRMAWHTAPTLPERAQFVWLGNSLVRPPSSRTEPETDVAPVVRPPPPDVAVTEPTPAPVERIRRRAPFPTSNAAVKMLEDEGWFKENPNFYTAFDQILSASKVLVTF